VTTLKLLPKIDGSKSTIRAVVDQNVRAEIYYDFMGDFCPSPDGLGNAAAVAFLPYAMRNGLNLHVDGVVDSDLLLQLDEAQDAWSRWHPSLFRPVRITVEEVRAATLATTSTAVAAFSGGLDATYAVHAHKRRLIGRRSLDIRAGVLVQGFDLPLDQPDLFDGAKLRAAAILKKYDASLITVRTNWRSLDIPWQHTFIFAVAGVLHQFKGAFGHGVIAADNAYEDEDVGQFANNSITNQMMSGSSFPIRFTGSGRSRTEKAGIVGQEREVLDHLRVCWECPNNLGNCGACEKCIRTKLNFMANGIKDVPALGARVTPEQIAMMWLPSATGLKFFAELLKQPWADEPRIRAAILALVKRGVRRPRGIRKVLFKYKRSLLKRGLWPV
jgi:hypothetical protein